jgi:hypothetical protein
MTTLKKGEAREAKSNRRRTNVAPCYLDILTDGVALLELLDDERPVVDVHVHRRVHLGHAAHVKVLLTQKIVDSSVYRFNFLIWISKPGSRFGTRRNKKALK